jgi:hypothetical protein
MYIWGSNSEFIFFIVLYFLTLIFTRSMKMIGTYKHLLKTLPLLIALGSVTSMAYAEVTPAPEHPGQHNVVAKTPEEHTTATEHHKKKAEYHSGMAAHHHSLAKEYKQTKYQDLAKHHENLAKHHHALAKEHEATAKTHNAHAIAK